MLDAILENGNSSKDFGQKFTEYAKDPNSIIIPTLDDETLKEFDFLCYVYDKGLRSYAIYPPFFSLVISNSSFLYFLPLPPLLKQSSSISWLRLSSLLSCPLMFRIFFCPTNDIPAGEIVLQH